MSNLFAREAVDTHRFDLLQTARGKDLTRRSGRSLKRAAGGALRWRPDQCTFRAAAAGSAPITPDW